MGRSENTLKEAAKAAGASCRYIIADVPDEAAMEKAIDTPDKLHIVVSNAGVSFPTRENDPREKWRQMIEVNQWGTLNTCLAAGRRMQKDKTHPGSTRGM